MGGFISKLGPLKDLFFKLINRLVLTKMGKTAEDYTRISEVVGALVLEQVLAVSETPLSSEEKHKSVAAQVIAIIKEPGGIETADWVLEYLDKYLDDLIAAAVKLAHDNGLFGH